MTYPVRGLEFPGGSPGNLTCAGSCAFTPSIGQIKSLRLSSYRIHWEGIGQMESWDPDLMEQFERRLSGEIQPPSRELLVPWSTGY